MNSMLELSMEHYLVFTLSRNGFFETSNDRTNVSLSVKKNAIRGQHFSKFVSRKSEIDLDKIFSLDFWRGEVLLYNHKKRYHFKIGLTITLKDNLLHCVGFPIKTSKENKEVLKRLYHYINKYE